MSHHHDHNESKKHQDHGHHIVPLGVYYRVFTGLVVLTIVTVASSYVDFGGSTNILIAMIIATIKALLVILFFMGLRYEGQENNVTFFCSFVFLAIFVGLTSADIFYRSETLPAAVDASELQQSSAPIEVNKLKDASPELLTKGKTIFGQQCMSCHGGEGKGDGPAAAALIPKPRNFTQADGWKNGRGVTQIFKTLTNGVPGSAMPAFGTLSAEEKFALAHFVRSLAPNAPQDKPEEFAALQKEVGGPVKPHISVQQALETMAHEWESTHGKN